MMTPREVFNALRAYASERERRANFALDVMRLGLTTWFNLSVPPGKRIQDPRQILRFKHDDPISETESEIHIPTAEEWEEMDRRLIPGSPPGDENSG